MNNFNLQKNRNIGVFDTEVESKLISICFDEFDSELLISFVIVSAFNTLNFIFICQYNSFLFIEKYKKMQEV